MERINLIFSISARNAIRDAMYIASKHGLASIAPEHLLIALIQGQQNAALSLLKQFTPRIDAIVSHLKLATDNAHAQTQSTIRYTPQVKALIQNAITWALYTKSSYVGTQHILLSLASPYVGIPDAFACVGISLNTLAPLAGPSKHFNQLEMTDDRLGEIVIQPGSANALLTIEKDETSWKLVKGSTTGSAVP